MRLLLTRPKSEALKDKEIFESYGFKVEILPTIDFRVFDFEVPPLEGFDYIYFGSKRGVEFFLKKVGTIPKTVKVLAVGRKTAEVLRNRGIEPYIVSNGSSEKLVELAKRGELQRGKILVPTAKVHTKNVYKLGELGFKVEVLPIYETVYLKYPTKEVIGALENTDIVILTSPSTFLSLLENLQKRADLLQKKIIVAIGGTTAEAVREKGFKVGFVPTQPYTETLAKELAEAVYGFEGENFKS